MTNLTTFDSFSNISINSTHNDSNDAYTIWQKGLFSLFMFPIIIFSICGNILVLVAISKYSYLKITNNIFLASLAIADLSVGILAMPPNALQLLTGHWYLKSFMCRFWLASDVLFSTSSILHLCCVSIDRFLSISDKYAIEYKSEHPTKSLRVRLMIGGCWITSALLSFGPIFSNIYTSQEQVNRIDSLDSVNGQCLMVVNLPYRFISSIVSFWLPGFGMITFYSLVLRKAYHLENNEFQKYRSIINHMSITNNQDENSTNENEGRFRVKKSSKRHSSNANDMANFAVGFKHSSAARNSKDVARIWRREFKVSLPILEVFF